MSIIEISFENIENNPECGHGPTLLFTRNVRGKIQKFYACSACRDRKECPFFLLEGEKVTESKRLLWQEMKGKVKIDSEMMRANYLKAMKSSADRRTFCDDCGFFVDRIVDHATHTLKKNIPDENMKKPSMILDAIQNDKKEAQFWFKDSTKNFILDSIKRLGYHKTTCIGSPTLHEISPNSLLLDLDHRYYSFYDENQFIWFNMFNFHFMSKGEEILKNHAQDSMVIIDPPFGARLEPIHYLISNLKKMAENINFMLILPYFMEPQVLKFLEGFEMLDFPVEYANHKKFNKESPVRLFTDADAAKLVMPEELGFWFCDRCSRYRSPENSHCDLCKTCTSKNGKRYLHCPLCDKCVKDTWAHCILCNTCSYPEGHKCEKQANKSRKIDIQNKKRKK